jgi:flagellar biosynthetic protein FlhB
MAMGQIRKVVPKADVVITNPTHYAVALQYDQSRAAAPFVVAKGTDEIALYIRQVAAESNIEIVEFPAGTLRLLHHPGESTDPISTVSGDCTRPDLCTANETLA